MSAATTATTTSEPRRRAKNTQAGSSGPFEFLSIAGYTAGALLSSWAGQKQVLTHAHLRYGFGWRRAARQATTNDK
jgi:hypothetical protein